LHSQAKKFIYHDKDGNITGVGEEVELRVPTDKPGLEVLQVIRSGAGNLSDDKTEVDDDTFKELNDPKNNFKDYKAKDGKVDRLDKHT
jgi:hypothetical protein